MLGTVWVMATAWDPMVSELGKEPDPWSASALDSDCSDHPAHAWAWAEAVDSASVWEPEQDLRDQVVVGSWARA